MAVAIPKAQTWLSKWKNRSKVELVFSPANWGYTLNHVNEAYQADCPTLLQYDEVYGEEASVEWVKIQLLALYGASNCKDIGIVDGIDLFARAFAGDVKTFKISELLLFFARYKAGRYDNSFASFDSKRIGNAFRFEFLKERNYELDKIIKAQVQEEIEKRAFTPPAGYSSYSWYQELKIRAANGDSEAILLLSNKN